MLYGRSRKLEDSALAHSIKHALGRPSLVSLSALSTVKLSLFRNQCKIKATNDKRLSQGMDWTISKT